MLFGEAFDSGALRGVVKKNKQSNYVDFRQGVRPTDNYVQTIQIYLLIYLL